MAKVLLTRPRLRSSYRGNNAVTCMRGEMRMRKVAGSFEDIVALEPQHTALLSALRALASEMHPDHVEVSRPGDRAVSWGWGPKKMSEAYMCALPYTGHVNLAFYHGARLPDPNCKLRGTGKAMRHVSVVDLSELSDSSLRDLIIAAREERRLALGLAG